VCKATSTYIDFGVDNIDETSEDDYKIEHIPRITKVILANKHRFAAPL